MSIRKIHTFFRVLKNLSFFPLVPPKKKILLFDNNLEELLLKYIKPKDYAVLNIRDNRYNFYVLLKTFFTSFLNFSSLKYFNNYIKYTDPKIIITFSDNYKIFYKIEKPKKSKKIFIQGAWRTALNDIFSEIDELKKEKKNNVVDYMLVYSDIIGKKYSSFIQGKCLSIGSFRSNSYKIKKPKSKNIMYISQWRDFDPNLNLTPTIKFIRYLKNQENLVKNLYNYCIRRKKKLIIYGKEPSKLKYKEKAFYKNILGNKNWTFVNNIREKSYDMADKYELIVNISSSMGYEALSRGSKVAFFNTDVLDKTTSSKTFGWPNKFKSKGFFWDNNLSQAGCDQLLDKVLNYKKNYWIKISARYTKKMIRRDENNSKFVKLIKKYS